MSIKSHLRAEAKGAVIGAVAGAPSGVACFFLFRDDLALLQDHYAAFILAMFVAYYPLIVMHEVGHVLAGWLVRFRFHRFVAGPLVISHRVDRPRMQFLYRSNWLSGRVLMLPVSASALPFRMTALILGGAGINFLLVVAAVLLDRARGPMGGTSSWGTIALLGGASDSLFLGIYTLIPYRAGPLPPPSDGWQLLALLRARRAAAQRAAAWVLRRYHTAGYRSRDVPRSLVQLAIGMPAAREDAAPSMLIAYYWALDSGLIMEADTYLIQAATLNDSFTDVGRAVLVGERAFFLARYQHDPQAAVAMLQAIPPGCPKPIVLRAQAAINLAVGKPEAAMEDAEEGLRVLARDYSTMNALEDRDWLCTIIAEAREQMFLVATAQE